MAFPSDLITAGEKIAPKAGSRNCALGWGTRQIRAIMSGWKLPRHQLDSLQSLPEKAQLAKSTLCPPWSIKEEDVSPCSR